MITDPDVLAVLKALDLRFDVLEDKIDAMDDITMSLKGRIHTLCELIEKYTEDQDEKILCTRCIPGGCGSNFTKLCHKTAKK